MKALSPGFGISADDWTSHFCSETVEGRAAGYPSRVTMRAAVGEPTQVDDGTARRLHDLSRTSFRIASLHRAGRIPWVVLGTALILRLTIFLVVCLRYPHQWLFSRGLEMGLLADSLVHRTGYSSPFGASTGPTAFIAPGYPTLIAGIFYIFGSYSFMSAQVVMLLQILVSLVTIWLMTCIAHETMSQRAATIAGVVWAVSLPLLWMPTIFWETSLSACLLTGMVFMGVRRQQWGMRMWGASGAYCAVAGLINPALLPSLLGMLGWVALRRRGTGWREPLLGVATFLLVFSAWPVRNAIRFHAFIPLRSTVGFELWMGNRPGATGYLDESLFPTYNKRELSTYIAQGEVSYTKEKTRQATSFILQEPVTFLGLSLRRVVRFWMGTGNSNGSAIFAMHASLTTLFGFGGLILLFRRRMKDVAGLVAIPLLLFPLPYYITHAEFRYRLVIDPLLTILGAYVVVHFIDAAKNKGLSTIAPHRVP